MKKMFGLLVFSLGFFATTYAVGQIYDGKYESSTGPMDRAASQHAVVYADVAAPGEAEEAIPQEERYTNMIEPIDNAVGHHFDELEGYQTVEDQNAIK